jgi:hypothetical protein
MNTESSADSDRYSNRYWVLFYQHIAAQASEREADERAMQELHAGEKLGIVSKNDKSLQPNCNDVDGGLNNHQPIGSTQMHTWIMFNTLTGQRKAVSDCMRYMMPAQWISAYRADQPNETVFHCEHGHPRCAIEAQPWNYCSEEHQ